MRRKESERPYSGGEGASMKESGKLEVALVSATRKDLDACVDILMDSILGEEYFTRDIAEPILSEAIARKEVIVAKTGAGEVLGFYRLAPDGVFLVFAYLHLLAVKTGRRGMGIGSRLLRDAERKIRNAGVPGPEEVLPARGKDEPARKAILRARGLHEGEHAEQPLLRGRHRVPHGQGSREKSCPQATRTTRSSKGGPGLNHGNFVVLVAAQVIAGLGALVALSFVSAPYGKHSRPGWGPKMNSKTAWILMESPAALVIALMFLASGDRSAGAFFALGLWEMHYIYRSYVYSSLQRGSKPSFPIVLAAAAVVFNVNNGLINGHDLFASGKADLVRLSSPRCALGLLVFVGGFALHVVSDAAIRSLRKDGETGYKIPYGGMFRFVSNPNYLGEILEWTGFALMTRSAAAWAFAFFTFCNIFPRAVANHRWYREHFPDYPSDRKIILPFFF